MRKVPKVRSVIAQELRTPKFRSRVVKSAKQYTRKGRARIHHKDAGFSYPISSRTGQWSEPMTSGRISAFFKYFLSEVLAKI